MNKQNVRTFLVENGILVALLGILVFFTTQNANFIAPTNLQNILLSVAELGFIALPLAFLVMAGTLDLSLGSIASMGAVLSGFVMLSTESVTLGVLAGVAFGAIAGAINGALISFGGLNPIVITLGFLAVWAGAALTLTGGGTVYGFPASFLELGTFRLGPVSLQLVLLGVLGLVAAIVLNRLPLGRQVLAIGGNPRVAFLMGVRVKQIKFGLFVFAGAMAGLAGVMLAAKLQASPPTVGSGLELRALTVVLLGGVAFAGGYGRIAGILSGLVFVGVLSNGLIIIGVTQFLQEIVIGFALVIAIAFDNWVRRFVRASVDDSKPKKE
jgi:ribose/xylose/arabinose/galactoside ABC-type transport system permease subunit